MNILDINKENLELACCVIETKVNQFNREYKQEYPNDWGSCGSGMIDLVFGRKIKVRKHLQSLGMIGQFKDYNSGYALKIRFPHLGFQNDDYNSKRLNLIRDLIEEHFQFEKQGVKVVVQTWVD